MSKKILSVLMVFFSIQITAVQSLRTPVRKAPQMFGVVRGMRTQPTFAAFRFRDSVDYSQYSKPTFLERINNYLRRVRNQFKNLIYGSNPYVIVKNNGTLIVPKSQTYTTQPVEQSLSITPQESNLLFPHVSESPYAKVPSDHVEKVGHGVLNAAPAIKIERGIIEEIIKGHGHKGLPVASKTLLGDAVDVQLYKGVLGRFQERDEKLKTEESKEQRKERSIQNMADEGFFEEYGIDMQDKSVRQAVERIVGDVQREEDFYEKMTSLFDETLSKKIERIEDVQKDLLEMVRSAYDSAKVYPSFMAKVNNARVAVTNREGLGLYNKLEEKRQALLQQEEAKVGAQGVIKRLQKSSADSLEKEQKQWRKEQAIQKMAQDGFFEQNKIDMQDKSVRQAVEGIVDDVQRREDLHKEITSLYDETLSKKIERIEGTQKEILEMVKSAYDSVKADPSLAKENNAAVAVVNREGFRLYNQLEEERQALLQKEEATAGGVQNEIKRLQKSSADSFEKEQKQWRKEQAIQKMAQDGFFEQHGIDMQDKSVRQAVERILGYVQREQDFYEKMTSLYDETLSEKIERAEKARGQILELVQSIHESSKKFPSLAKQNNAEIAVVEREGLEWYNHLTQEVEKLITEKEGLKWYNYLLKKFRELEILERK